MSSEKGQSLFEVVVALAVVTLVLLAVVALAALSIANSSFSRSKTLATNTAQATTEWLRGERDLDWEGFVARTNAPVWCLRELTWSAPAARIGSCEDDDLVAETLFRREVILSSVAPQTVEAKVTIAWNDSQGYHEVVSSTYFTNWRGQ